MKQQSKKQPRNYAAISAHFRKAGVMTDKRKEADWKEEAIEDIKYLKQDNICSKCEYYEKQGLQNAKELQDIKIHIDEMLTTTEKEKHRIQDNQSISFQVFRLLEAIIDLEREVQGLKKDLFST